MPKKLQVEETLPNDELKNILEQMKIKEGVVEPVMESKVSEKQKKHLDEIRTKAVQAKKTNKQKLEFLEKYYIQKEKEAINKKVQKEVYAKRKDREQKKKVQPSEPEPEEDEIEEEDEVEEEEEDEEESEEEYIPPPKKKPAKVQPSVGSFRREQVPVKKKIQPQPQPQKRTVPPPRNGGYNAFAGIM